MKKYQINWGGKDYVVPKMIEQDTDPDIAYWISIWGQGQGNTSTEADFQQIPLAKGGQYTFRSDSAGKLEFLTGTTFPLGIKVDTTATFQCPVTIDANGGTIQIGASHGQGGGPGAGSENQADQTGVQNTIGGGDIITVYGDVWTLPEYINDLGSDIRAKTNIKPISNALDKINQLSGNSFEWKTVFKPAQTKKVGDSDYGVIAQEVQKIMPEIVDEKNGWLTVDYVKLIPLLIESIKDLTKQVEELKG